MVFWRLIIRLLGKFDFSEIDKLKIKFRFFRVCTEICVDVSPQDDVKGRYHIYSQIDAFVRLVCLLIKHSGDAHNPGQF